VQTQVVVNGLEVEAVVDHCLVDALVPRLEELAAQVPAGRRDFVFLAAPPGAGKSTLAAVLVKCAEQLQMQTVGIDGFHFPRSVLTGRFVETELGRVPLATVKGAPETFDVVALDRQLRASRERDLVWPEYDRRVHEVVPGREPVSASLVLVEGNWLLLDEPGWSDLTEHSVYNVFIEAEPALLRDRLIDRKIRGGLSRDEATAFYERSDRRNIERVLTRTDRSKVDLLLHLNPETTTTSGGVR